MAENKDQNKSRVLEILTKEYPAERIIMMVMGVLVTVTGVYLVTDDPFLTITNTDSWYTAWIFGTDTGILIFSYFILLMGILALVVALWPFFKPSLKEMKRVTWPNGTTIKNHSLRVFGFILFLMIMFVLFDIALRPLFGYING